MKTLEQITNEAAKRASTKLVGWAPELQIEKFTQGAEWERARQSDLIKLAYYAGVTAQENDQYIHDSFRLFLKENGLYTSLIEEPEQPF